MSIRGAAMLSLALSLASPPSVRAQPSAPQVQPPATTAGKYERITVHGASLEGNLEGDSPDRMRYPVLYLLHGFIDSDSRWFGLNGAHLVNVQSAADRADVRGAHELIIVMPDAFTKYAVSRMSSRSTTAIT